MFSVNCDRYCLLLPLSALFFAGDFGFVKQVNSVHDLINTDTLIKSQEYCGQLMFFVCCVVSVVYSYDSYSVTCTIRDKQSGVNLATVTHTVSAPRQPHALTFNSESS